MKNEEGGMNEGGVVRGQSTSLHEGIASCLAALLYRIHFRVRSSAEGVKPGLRRLIEAVTRQLPVAVFIFCIGHPSRFRLYFCYFYSKSFHLPSCIFRLGYRL